VTGPKPAVPSTGKNTAIASTVTAGAAASCSAGRRSRQDVAVTATVTPAIATNAPASALVAAAQTPRRAMSAGRR
jgi:hypothetical protein